MPDPHFESFLAALLNRHAAPLRRSEFLKAIRALSARYVERRAALADRSPLDSAGKRSAFAAYYAPLHYLTVTKVLDALETQGGPSRADLTRVIDLGCGTGVAGAAWATRCDAAVTIHGIDRSGWATVEAAWTYRTLGLRGRVTRGDLVRSAMSLAARGDRDLTRTGVILAWSSNELDDADRRRLLAALLDLGRAGASVLTVEPISRRAAPWFDEWADAITNAGGRHDDWRFEGPRPAALEAIDAEVGFDRDALTARSLAINLP